MHLILFLQPVWQRRLPAPSIAPPALLQWQSNNRHAAAKALKRVAIGPLSATPVDTGLFGQQMSAQLRPANLLARGQKRPATCA